MPRQYPQGPDRSGYLAEDTIAAISTALGGAIAIIRVSGPRAIGALHALSGIEDAEARRLLRARLRGEDGAELDDSMVALFRNPESFTGEDLVELHVHGGSYVAARVMEELSRLGVRQALPGEFSFRAVRNGKLALNQAEAINDLIRAANDQAISLALEKLSGTQNRLIRELAEELRSVAMLGEVGIDFADQDVDEVSLPRLKARLERVATALLRLKDGYGRGIRIQEGVAVAFIGLPNAGKSSFFNALLGEDRSIVSEVAGTTRDLIRERLTLRGRRGTVTLRLEDTAGLRITGDRVEQMGIERSQRSAREADLVLFIVDPAAGLEPVREQWALLMTAAGPGLPGKTLGVVTKSDLVAPGEVEVYRDALSALGVTRVVATSAQTGAGIPDAVEAITSFSESWISREKGEVLLTRLDHLRAVEEALVHLTRSKEVGEIDLFASDVRQALYALAPLIGETLPDDILGRIFSEFCIGK